MCTADPLEVGDGGTGRDGGLRVEEAVVGTGEGLPGTEDVDDGHFGRADPAQDVAGRGDDGVGEALDVEDVADFCAAEFLEGGDGEGAGVAVAEEGDEGAAVAFEAGDGGGVADIVVEGSVGAFC